MTKQDTKSYRNALRFIEQLPISLEAPASTAHKKLLGFIFLWMAYNQAYERHSKVRYERDRFRLYFVQVGQSFFNTHKAKIREDFFQTLPKGRDNIRGMRSNLKNGIETVDQLSDALYQIRCNLFHGSKELFDEDEQRLVGWAYDILLAVAKEQ